MPTQAAWKMLDTWATKVAKMSTKGFDAKEQRIIRTEIRRNSGVKDDLVDSMLGNLVQRNLFRQRKGGTNKLLDVWARGNYREGGKYYFDVEPAPDLKIDVTQGYMGTCAIDSAIASGTVQYSVEGNRQRVATKLFTADGRTEWYISNRALPINGTRDVLSGMIQKSFAIAHEDDKLIGYGDSRSGYDKISGGNWPADALYRTTGQKSTHYFVDPTKGFTATSEVTRQPIGIGPQSLADRLAAGGYRAAILATTMTGDGLVPNHAYTLLSYNASTGIATVRNPWGIDGNSAREWQGGNPNDGILNVPINQFYYGAVV